jgi:hypothetical protein
MARTAAWSVALKNLVEVVNGVYVDSTTTVTNYVTTSAEVRTRVEGMVRAAKVIKERELPDGSFEITVQMSLADGFSQVIRPVVPPKAERIKRFENAAPQPPPPTHYTGVVIDARGLGVKACMYPRILTEEGEEAYSMGYVDKAVSPELRVATYAKDMTWAQNHDLVKAVPLIVKALRVEGANRTDLVISDADAQTLHLIPEHRKLINRAKVIIVMDPQ